MDGSLWLWGGFIAFILTMLALDLGVFHKEEKEETIRSSLIWCGIWASLAAIFAAGIFIYHPRGSEAGLEFVTGYIIEWSLSIDNIFVFVTIFAHFAVPPAYQHRVLFWGILGALIMRATMILAGAALISEFVWIMYVFGAFLVVTGIKMGIAADSHGGNIEDSRVVRFLRRYLRVTPGYEGNRFFIRRNGVIWVTPLFIVLCLVETTDLIFAIDSIPAIFAVTRDPFIVFTANVFAILGLRSLYFALRGLIDMFHYLKYGLAIVLVGVGIKLILVPLEIKLPTALTLGFTVGVLSLSVLVSILRPRRLAS